MFFPQLWIKSWKRLLHDHGREDGDSRALARRHMAPAAGTAHFPGPDSRIGSVQSIIRCRNAGLRVYRAATCRYCHARRRSCDRSSYPRTSACISSAARHCTSTRAAIKPHIPYHQTSIALFGKWDTRRTCACLDAREARRAP